MSIQIFCLLFFLGFLGGWWWEGPHLVAGGILVLPPGIEPWALAVKVLSPNHWTTRKFQLFSLNWSIVDLQCCVSFKCTAKWLTFVYVYIFFSRFFSFIGYYKIVNVIHSLSYMLGPCWLLFLLKAVWVIFLGGAAHHSLRNFPNQESNLIRLHWKRGVLTTGPPVKSWVIYIFCKFINFT